MKCDKSRKRMDSDHLQVANPIRPEDLDRRVAHQGSILHSQLHGVYHGVLM